MDITTSPSAAASYQIVPNRPAWSNRCSRGSDTIACRWARWCVACRSREFLARGVKLVGTARPCGKCCKIRLIMGSRRSKKYAWANRARNCGIGARAGIDLGPRGACGDSRPGPGGREPLSRRTRTICAEPPAVWRTEVASALPAARLGGVRLLWLRLYRQTVSRPTDPRRAALSLCLLPLQWSPGGASRGSSCLPKQAVAH